MLVTARLPKEKAPSVERDYLVCISARVIYAGDLLPSISAFMSPSELQACGLIPLGPTVSTNKLREHHPLKCLSEADKIEMRESSQNLIKGAPSSNEAGFHIGFSSWSRSIIVNAGN
jgi:hypothetical protein